MGALLLTFDAEFPDGGRLSTMPNASLPPGDIPSHWAQQVFLKGDGWKVWPGDVLGFSVIWSDWGIQGTHFEKSQFQRLFSQHTRALTFQNAPSAGAAP